MKKITALLLALVMVFALCACGKEAPAKNDAESADNGSKTVKVGLICLHDENSGYDKNFIDAFIAACEACGVEYEMKKNVPEDQAAYDAAAELADDGCSLVISDSYGHQQYILQAAQEFTDVQFTACTGDMALNEDLDNYHNAFATIFEGRYLAGVAAGMKLNEMIENGDITEAEAKMGYVGAMPYAEVKSGYTSFYLGAKSVCPSVTMDVIFTGSWYDETLEMEGAKSLIKDGCVLISQHADSMGAPNACQEAKVPNVSYNGSTQEACPDTYIISSRINWQPYFEYAIKAVMAGESFDTDWTGNLETESVLLTDLNEDVAAEGTADKLAEVEAGLKDGSIQVFDTANWTVDGKTLDSYTDSFGMNGAECIDNGIFTESSLRSAPYFDITIDGITIKE